MGQHLGSRAGNFEDLPARRAGIVPNLILRTDPIAVRKTPEGDLGVKIKEIL